jgi:hypothetical protein
MSHLGRRRLCLCCILSSLGALPRCTQPNSQPFLLKPGHSHIGTSWVILLTMASRRWIHIHLFHLTLCPIPHLTLLVKLTFLLVLLPSCRHCLRMILPNWFIARVLLFHPFALVIRLAVPKQRPIGPPKNFIGIWDVTVVGITSISSKPASTVNGLMVVSFRWPLGFLYNP